MVGMIGITVTAKGLNKYIYSNNPISKRTKQLVNMLPIELAELLVKTLQESASNYSDTGRLEHSIFAQDIGNKQAVVTIPVEYASALDKGSKAHFITGNPMLKFYWAKERRWAETHVVWHPGTEATYFVSEGIRNFRSDKDRIIKLSVKKTINI